VPGQTGFRVVRMTSINSLLSAGFCRKAQAPAFSVRSRLYCDLGRSEVHHWGARQWAGSGTHVPFPEGGQSFIFVNEQFWGRAAPGVRATRKGRDARFIFGCSQEQPRTSRIYTDQFFSLLPCLDLPSLDPFEFRARRSSRESMTHD
jgi:hypothetical protein